MSDLKQPIGVSTESVSSTSPSPKEELSPDASQVDVSVIKKAQANAFGVERELEAYYEPIAEYVSSDMSRCLMQAEHAESDRVLHRFADGGMGL